MRIVIRVLKFIKYVVYYTIFFPRFKYWYYDRYLRIYSWTRLTIFVCYCNDKRNNCFYSYTVLQNVYWFLNVLSLLPHFIHKYLFFCLCLPIFIYFFRATYSVFHTIYRLITAIHIYCLLQSWKNKHHFLRQCDSILLEEITKKRNFFL